MFAQCNEYAQNCEKNQSDLIFYLCFEPSGTLIFLIGTSGSKFKSLITKKLTNLKKPFQKVYRKD